jgi:hypothetical protein
VRKTFCAEVRFPTFVLFSRSLGTIATFLLFVPGLMPLGRIAVDAHLTGGCAEDRMKLKLDDPGHVAVSEGKPVYVHDNSKEVVLTRPPPWPRSVSSMARLSVASGVMPTIDLASQPKEIQ